MCSDIQQTSSSKKKRKDKSFFFFFIEAYKLTPTLNKIDISVNFIHVIVNNRIDTFRF